MIVHMLEKGGLEFEVRWGGGFLLLALLGPLGPK